METKHSLHNKENKIFGLWATILRPQVQAPGHIQPWAMLTVQLPIETTNAFFKFELEFKQRPEKKKHW